ncbi:hypothetical protein C8A03DRAFT_18840 [Achaetomium macrosporum]|uniref:Uncharacterized protein n=1 Tax=Achaetomium macrosporum TaxID=79813 RepID=A0AAN7C2P4_9PEZI|nr:hypothetical protein C8A03DRAFT_18840 [Achaetomium macrosporum]
MDLDRETEEFKSQCLDYLDNVLEEIEGFGDDIYILSDEHLASLNIRKLEPLDVEEQFVDFGPRSFYPRFTLEQAQQRTADFVAGHEEYLGYHIWPKRCRRGSYVSVLEDPQGYYDPEEMHPLCDPVTDARFRLRWFLEVSGMGYGSHPGEADLGVWDGSEWYCIHACDLVPGGRYNLPLRNPRDTLVGDPPRPYAFHVCMAFLIEDPSAEKPHIGGTVVDSTESGERDVLRSEVAAAIGLLKHQFRRGDFRQHHTLPAIVFSFQHDKFGRITQFHFDGRSLMLRQSRLLNFRSDEPTTDAYHMLRWMANQPMDETRFLKTGADVVKGTELDTDKTDGRLPVDVPGS